MKRVIKLAAVLLAGAFLSVPASSRAETYNDGTYEWTWQYDDTGDGAVLVGSRGHWEMRLDGEVWINCLTRGVEPEPEGAVTVPAFVTVSGNQIPVVGLDDVLFINCAGMTEAILPDTVRKIGSGVFGGCTGLAKINAPAELEECSRSCFYGTPWLKAQTNDFVTLGNVLLSYQGEAESVKIPDGIVTIGDDAFSGNETIASVEIPDSVTRIGSCAFADCVKLLAVTGADNVLNCGAYAFSGSAFFNTDPDDETDGAPVRVADMIVGYKGTLPDELVIEDGVTCIADSVFYECADFSSVVFPESLCTIGEAAFYGCAGLTELTLPETIETIGQDAFSDCASLEDLAVYCGEALVRFADYGGGFNVFTDCPVKYLTIDNLDTDGKTWNWDFYSTLESLAIGENVSSIPSSAFSGYTVLQEVSFGSGLLQIDENAFAGCESLTSVTIPSSVETIGDYAFDECVSLEEVAFEGDMDAIDMNLYRAFYETPWLESYLASIAPENDDFENAAELEGESGSEGGTLDGTTIEETDTLLSNWFKEADGSVWYAWTAPVSGVARFTASADDEEFDDALLHLLATRGYVEAPGSTNGEWVVCGEATCGEEEDERGLVFNVTEGETYYIAVARSWQWDTTGAFTLSWETGEAPENDAFENAAELEGGEGSVEGTSLFASAEEGDPLVSSFNSTATVWWKWTAEIDGEITFDTAGSEFDTVMGVYTGESLDTLEEVATNDDEEGSTTYLVTFDATAGTTYYIAVGGYGDGSGAIMLNWYRYKLDIDDGVLYGYTGTLPETLDIPEGVTCIAESAFQETAVSTVNLPASLEVIGTSAFADSALETVNGLSESVNVMPGAFDNTLFQRTTPFRLLINQDKVLTGFLGICPANLEIPDGVVEIAESAFDADYNGWNEKLPADGQGEEGEEIWHSNLDALVSVSIPSSVQSIDEYAFCGCANLATVAIENPWVLIEWTAFNGSDNLASLSLEAADGRVQTGWQLNFGSPVYASYIYTEYDDEEKPIFHDETDHENPVYAAGETLTFPVDDLSFLIDGISVTNEEDVVGWLACQEVRAVEVCGTCGCETNTNWVSVPVWVSAVWERTTPEIFETEPTDAFAGNAQYTGWLRDAEGNLVGTILVKATKANKKGESKLTASVVELATGKKLTFKGTVGASGEASLSGKGGPLVLSLTDDSMTGRIGSQTVEAAKNVFVSKDSGDKASASLVGKKTWTVTLDSDASYTPFTLTVAAKGKTKVTGVLPDGTKVSASAQAVVGDGGRWAVPVMYAKKYKFGFVAWFEKGADGQTTFTGVSDLTPLHGPKNYVLDWEVVSEACGPAGSLATGAHAFTVAAEDVATLGISGLLADLLPDGETVTVAKGKWTCAKAAKVAYKKGSLTVTPASKGGAVQNAAGVKLTFTAKTGTFKGAFTVYSVKGGKLVKTKFTVNGAAVGGAAYGTAFNKKEGSVPVVIQ